MATIVNTLYPPLMETFMPAFPYNQTYIKVNFSFSPYNDLSQIKKVHVSLVNQRTNESIFKNNYSFNATSASNRNKGAISNNIWIIPFNQTNETGITQYLTVNKTKNTGTLLIPISKNTSLLSKELVINNYYKVQIRFDNEPELDFLTQTQSNVRNNLKDYLVTKRQFFSEWSSVCLVRPIPQVRLLMKEFDTIQGNKVTNNIRSVQPGIIPIAGNLISYKNNNINSEITTIKNGKEKIQKYKITITNADKTEVIDSTDWVFPEDKSSSDEIFWLADISKAELEEQYIITINCVTTNQYSFSQTYKIKILNFDPIEFEPQWIFKKVSLNHYSDIDSKIITEEDGIVNFSIYVPNDLPMGYLYVKRASSLDNFKNWELISCTKNSGQLNKSFSDYSVGSMVKYRYACQYKIKRNKMWTQTKYSQDTDGNALYIYPDFYDMILTRKNKQLALRYNVQVSSYSSVINRQVINTLGNKYPKFAENAKTNYKKLTISGLLTAEADFNRKFLDDKDYFKQMEDYNKYMDGKYEVRNDTLADNTLTYENYPLSYLETINATKNLTKNTLHDLYPKDNWWWERLFREEVISWLNDGEPKLLRSMTEGNLIVMLTDISLTPNPQVGRRIYNISMTAYEVGDGYSLEELSSLGVIDIPDEYSDEMFKGMADQDSDEDDSDTNTVLKTNIGQFYSRTVTNSSLALVDTGTAPLTNPKIEEYSIRDLLGFLYQGALNSYTTVVGSYYLTDVKIHFESPPQWYNTVNSNKIEIQTTESNIKKQLQSINKDNFFFGYKIMLSTTESQNIPILVEEKGYYQIPSNIKVTNIRFDAGTVATVDYKLNYLRTYNEIFLPTESSVVEKIVGQLDGRWLPGETVFSEIQSKYDFSYKETDVSKGYDGLMEKQYFNKMTSFSFEGTSYTVLSIRFEKEDWTQQKQYLVGRTGVYNLARDFPIEEVTFVGRRMFLQENFDYWTNRSDIKKYGLNEWEFSLDKSVFLEDAIKLSLKWYKFLEGKTNTDVNIVKEQNDESEKYSNIFHYIRSKEESKEEIIEKYQILNREISEITNLEYNTVYAFSNEEDLTKNPLYKIYYIDGQWYDVVFENEEKTMITASVPVYGMVNYQGTLVKLKYS